MDNIQEQPQFEADYNPLQENVQQRAYTRPIVQNSDATPIDEPVFTPPSFEELQSGFEQDMNGAPQGDGRKVWGQSDDDMSNANPYVEQLDSKDQKLAATAMAEAVLDGYAHINKFANKLIQFNIPKIEEMVAKGEIDGSLQLPLSDNESVTFLQYCTEFNKQTEGVLHVSQEFKDQAKPILIRIFMKRGIGMTDEQHLIYLVGVDVFSKVVTIVQVSKQMKSMTATMVEMTIAYRSSGQVPQPQYKQAQPQAQPQYEQPQQPNTPPQREYTEPEEVQIVNKEEPIQDAIFVDTPAKKTRRRTAMPQFGDTEILSQMEKIANGEVKQTRGRRKK